MGASAKSIVTIAIGLLMTAILVPIGLQELANASIPATMSSVSTILTVVLPILAVIGIALKFMD